jgi:hypothetical protein
VEVAAVVLELLVLAVQVAVQMDLLLVAALLVQMQLLVAVVAVVELENLTRQQQQQVVLGEVVS